MKECDTCGDFVDTLIDVDNENGEILHVCETCLETLSEDDPEVEDESTIPEGATSADDEDEDEEDDDD